MEVAFLPWAGLSEPITLGRVELWPFWAERQTRIQQKSVLRYLERYLRCYRSNSNGTAAGPQVVCTHADAPDFEPLTSRQRQEIRDAVNVVTLTSIIPNIVMSVCTDNNSVAPPNSERYQLFFQAFHPTDSYFAVQSGDVLHGGVKIGSVRFAMPWSVGGDLLGSCDPDVLHAFGKLLAQKRRAAETRRLFQSLDWFRFAHVGAEDASIFSKVVMMGTAFEILLGVGGIEAKRHTLVERIDQILDEGSHKKETRQIPSRSGKTVPPVTHKQPAARMKSSSEHSISRRDQERRPQAITRMEACAAKRLVT